MPSPATPRKRLTAWARRWPGKLALLLMLAVVAGLAIWLLRDRLSLAELATREAQLREFYQQHPFVTIGVAALVYLTIAALSVPAGTPLSLLYGWLFGWLLGVCIVNSMSTAGAVLAFWSSRYLVRDFVEHWLGDRVYAIERRIESDGPFYLLALRLIPIIPFFVVNLAMGLTRMRTRTFALVSQIGMLPATCVYVGVGASVPSLEKIAREGLQGLISWQLVLALAALGCLPLLMKVVVRYWQGRHRLPG